MKLILELFNFLKSPNIKLSITDRKVFFTAFKQFLIFDIVLSITFGFIIVFMSFLFDDFETVFRSKHKLDYPILIRLFLVTLVAPLLEELSFRLGLKITRVNVSISLAIQIIIILKLIGFIQYPLYVRVLLMVATSIFLFFIIRKTQLLFFKSNFNYFIYFNIIAFGLLHAFNYTFTYYADYLFIPFLVSVQIVLGIYLSYARLKYGFLFALFIHSFHNTVLILLSLIHLK